jgi:hypothetical protein
MGFYLKPNNYRKEDWKWLLKKLDKRLNTWSHMWLSRVGRLVLVNMVLEEILVYWMSFSLIRVDIGGHRPIPPISSCPFFIQHVFLYRFIIMSSTLLRLSEASQILQLDTGGLSPNPIGLFCMFSCQHILLYFQGCFGDLNIVFLTLHNQILDGVRV